MADLRVPDEAFERLPELRGVGQERHAAVLDLGPQRPLSQGRPSVGMLRQTACKLNVKWLGFRRSRQAKGTGWPPLGSCELA